MRLAPILLPCFLFLSACASLPPATGLAGTSWRLERFESPDDRAAVLRPDGSRRYTLAFGNDGRLAAILDCNRGAGPWQAVAGDAGGGSLHIGPLSTTRAMCAPDPVGTRLSRDLDAVAGYRLRDGRLYLSLPVDAGVYVWEPIAP